MFQAGRGAGKTEACARYFAAYMRANAGHRGRIIAPTFGDAVEACVVGPSGLQAIDPEVKWLPSAPGGAKVVWPNGSEALLIGTPFPRDVDRLRAGGNRHIDWWEEAAANPQLRAAMDQAALGLRLGLRPHWIGSSTPRSTRDYREVVAMAGVVVTRGSTFDNPHNGEEWREAMRARFAHTRLGRQELLGEIIDDVEGALWTRAMFDAGRVAPEQVPDLVRVVVAVDPAASAKPSSADTGIVVAGLGSDGDAYVLDDRTCHLSPEGWGQRAIRAYHRYDADLIVGEGNHGGEMVESVIRAQDETGNVPVEIVYASRGKEIRAQPVAALYGAPPKRPPRVHHVGGFPELEDQCATWVPGDEKSPDRLDALVWALTELMLGQQARWTAL